MTVNNFYTVDLLQMIRLLIVFILLMVNSVYNVDQCDEFTLILFLLLMVNSVYNVDQLDMNCPFYCFYTVDGQYFLYC